MEGEKDRLDQDRARLQSPWEDLGFHLVCDGRSLEGFEQGVI